MKAASAMPIDPPINPDFRLLFESLPGAFLVLDPELKLVAISDELMHATLTKREEILGHYVFDVLPDDPSNPTGFERWRRSLESVLRTRAPDTMPDVKYSVKRPPSEGGGFVEKYWRPANFPVLGQDGEVRYIIHRTKEITEQKRAENELQFEKQKLEAIFRESPAAMALWRGPELIFEMVNPGYQALFPGRQLLGLSFVDAVPELKGQPFADLLLGVFRTGKSCVGTEVLARHRRTRDGPIEDRYYDFNYVQINDSEGRPYGVFDHAVDVTERVLARKSLEESERRLKFIADSIPIHLFQLDRNERILSANKAAAEMWRRTPEEMAGKTIQEITTSVASNDLNPQAQKALRGERITFESPYRLPDGSSRVFLNTYTAERTPDGQTVGSLATGTDITDRSRFEGALRRSEAHFRQLADSMPQIVWIALADGNLDYFNRRFAQYTGSSPAEATGSAWAKFVHPDDLARVGREWSEALATGSPFVSEHRLRREDGEYRWHRANGIPIRDDHGKIFSWYGATTDVHEYRIEQELRERFVATLSHDLRTPLTAAKISAQLLARKSGDPEIVQKISGRIADNMDRADHMIRDLLDANRIKAGEKLPIEVEECELSEIASSTLEDLSTVHGDRFRLRAQSPIHGYFSRSGIRRILENLCTNAVKYGAPGRPITVSLGEQGKSVQIEVHNDGDRIPPEDQRFLFDPFRRTGSAQSSGQRGWGLGLTLVRGIAEAHGGSVSLTSDSDHGTTFRVVLPIKALPKTPSR